MIFPLRTAFRVPVSLPSTYLLSPPTPQVTLSPNSISTSPAALGAHGFGLRVWGLRASGSGLRVQASGFRVWGWGLGIGDYYRLHWSSMCWLLWIQSIVLFETRKGTTMETLGRV